MYTFDDWLYNRIIPEFWAEGNKPHSLHYTLSMANCISQEEWYKIMHAQGDTWDGALDLTFKGWVKYIKDHLDYDLVSDKSTFIELERRLIQSEIDGNIKAYQDIFITYKKEVFNITGTDYLQVRSYIASAYPHAFKLNIPEEDQVNFKMHLAKRKIDYLNGLKLTENQKSDQVKPFPEHLLTDKREILAERLKSEFNMEKGKSIRLLIEVLIADGLLTNYKNRQGKQLYNSMQQYLNRDIGSYQSIFNIKDDQIDQVDLKYIKQKVTFILESINKIE